MPFTHFECILCCEDKFEELPRWIGNSQSARICDSCARDCVAPLFHAALEYEHQYPPTCGKEKLDIWTFWDLFDDRFREAWRTNVQEYDMPVKERLYCEHRDSTSGIICGGFLGQRGLGMVLCSRCQCHTCKSCGTSDGNAASLGSHICKKAATVDALEEFQKGQQYQRCPGCEVVIFQAEGCNHMTCRPPCNAHFCFICGERVAAHQSGHWQPGGCPRFGVAGPRRIWNDPGEHSEDEEEESDDDDDDDDEKDDEMNLLEHLRDVRRVRRLIETFADAEQVERIRVRLTPSVMSVDSEPRVAFFGDVLANLNIVLQMMHTEFDVDQIPDQLREFSTRHERIRSQYDFLRANAHAQMGKVTQLSDLSDEFDAYFVFALETRADMTGIAAAHGRTP